MNVEQMKIEARELAVALRDGDGTTAMDILFASQYTAPADKAKLLQRVVVHLNG